MLGFGVQLGQVVVPWVVTLGLEDQLGQVVRWVVEVVSGDQAGQLGLFIGVVGRGVSSTASL